jgi:hypothetical protein
MVSFLANFIERVFAMTLSPLAGILIAFLQCWTYILSVLTAASQGIESVPGQGLGGVIELGICFALWECPFDVPKMLKAAGPANFFRYRLIPAARGTVISMAGVCWPHYFRH